MTKQSMRRVSLVIALACGAAAAEGEWQPLFNGKNLDGWTQRGGQAPYKVEGDAIVGTAVSGTPNSFLCTEKDYADFILEYEFKVDPRLNSGVQIRSHCFEEETEVFWEDKIKKVPAGRVHGYQVEIDPDMNRMRLWSAGIFEEAARGWLYPGEGGGDGKAFSEQGARVFKPGEWNSVRVEARGHSIKTFLNGELRADLVDSRLASGFIALQVHSIGKKDAEGATVAWRKLRIQDLGGRPNTLSEEEKKAGWKLLWDGKTTEGWRSIKAEGWPDKGWKIDNGVLRIEAKSGAGDLITRDKFSDFELKLEFMMSPKSNSGIKLFIESEPDQVKLAALGPEFQILDDQRHPDANNGKDGNRRLGSLYDLIPAPEDKKVMPVGGWNEAHIISKGRKVTFKLNGEITAEFERGSEAWREMVAGSKYKKNKGFGEAGEGHILLQDHYDLVFYRNIKIRVPEASP